MKVFVGTRRKHVEEWKYISTHSYLRYQIRAGETCLGGGGKRKLCINFEQFIADHF